jgi:hypothetical protein
MQICAFHSLNLFGPFIANRARIGFSLHIDSIARLCISVLNVRGGKKPVLCVGRRVKSDMITILLIILLLMALGALPTWPYSRGWGYYPSGGVSLVLVILIVLLLMGRI